MLELLYIFLGSFLGIITGITPGIHINLVAAILLTLSKTIKIDELTLIIIVISMSITHIFLDIIPSIFLGVPSEDSAAIILPAHKLLLEGKAHEAVLLTLVGTILSIGLIILISPLLIFILPKIQNILTSHIPVILILLLAFLILKEKNRFQVFIIFLLSGLLGIAALNIPNIKEPLLPLLSGLFGVSSLILSIKNNTLIPKQEFNRININIKQLKYIIIGVISGIISAFLPGFGSSQVSIICSSIIRKIESKDYLILNSSISAVNMVGSFITLYSINKARSGIAVAISTLISNFSIFKLIYIFGIILVTTFLATILTVFFSRIFAKIISKVNYKVLCISIILIITVLVLIMSKLIGLIILITSTSLGVYSQLKEVNKNHLMGCLVIPVLLYFLL